MNSRQYIEVSNTENLEQLLIGSYLGDGSFTKISNGAKNSRFSIAHSINQKEYCKRKWSLLNKYELAGKLSENKIYGDRYRNGYFEEVRFKSKAHPIFNKYRVDGYDEWGKKLNIKLVENISELGLAIWFMDDGSKTNDSCQFNCKSKFSEDEKYQLKTLLQLIFNLEINVTQDALYIPSSNFKYFKSIIELYVLDSLKYKLIPNRVLYKLG